MTGVIHQQNRANLTTDELADYLRDVEGIPVTRRQIRQAVLDREIVPSKFGNRNYFSIQDGLDWVASQKGRYRGEPRRVAAQNA